ncbi:LOW QUALITY PROTEIN: uncharacterized protein FPRO_12237 [Fusarium proliferatum ET1]|uniref:Uncharacterized protein n=1 Tax=Fusarium proliferatum (strain ET1) TaxID=1227346 RepID=A0A1L7W347_FUSPR|nr:LOW QUALITY PROTEIN: uncharacterized protein FPRO_12237 [Fusarium proliferatum ET1]CZR46786.1 uncharacterized protein FPRO_12237 [Fusarium proliferatum ET1]
MSTEPGIRTSTNDVLQTLTTLVSVHQFLATMETSTTNPTTIPTFDACVSAITSPDGEIPLTVREEQGSDLHVVTWQKSVNVSLSGASFAENVMPVTRNIAPGDEDDEATTIFPTQPQNLLRTVIPWMSFLKLVMALRAMEMETQSVLNFLRNRCMLGSMARNCGYWVSHNVHCH